MEERANGEFNVIYLLVLIVIAAILMFGIIKPMYAREARRVSKVKR